MKIRRITAVECFIFMLALMLLVNKEALARTPFPEFKEIDKVNAFLNQGTPQLGNDVRENIMLLVSHAKGQEALDYFMQHRSFFGEHYSLLLPYFQKIVNHDKEFKHDFSKVLASQKAKDALSLMRNINSMNSDSNKYVSGVDLVPEMLCGIKLQKAVLVYFRMANSLVKVVPVADKYLEKSKKEAKEEQRRRKIEFDRRILGL